MASHNCTAARNQMRTRHLPGSGCPHPRSSFWLRRSLLLPPLYIRSRSYSLTLQHSPVRHALRHILLNCDLRLPRCSPAPHVRSGYWYLPPLSASQSSPVPAPHSDLQLQTDARLPVPHTLFPAIYPSSTDASCYFQMLLLPPDTPYV